jgi:hypothetical protein
MKYVEDYFIIYQYQNPNLTFKKRVYLATDEPSVFTDARAKYERFLSKLPRSVKSISGTTGLVIIHSIQWRSQDFSKGGARHLVINMSKARHPITC